MQWVLRQKAGIGGITTDNYTHQRRGYREAIAPPQFLLTSAQFCCQKLNTSCPRDICTLCSRLLQLLHPKMQTKITRPSLRRRTRICDMQAQDTLRSARFVDTRLPRLYTWRVCQTHQRRGYREAIAPPQFLLTSEQGLYAQAFLPPKNSELQQHVHYQRT